MASIQHDSCKLAIYIVVHVFEPLDEPGKRRIEHVLLMAAGIKQAYFDDYREHLLIIGYNPAVIDTSTILDIVNQEHLSAKLIVGI